MDVVGLARTPRRVAEPLSAAAASIARAASELSALVRGGGDDEALAAALGASRNSWRTVMEETGHMLGGGLDRGDVLAIALSQKAVADGIEEAAAAVGATARAVTACGPIAGVIRDSARQLASAVDQLDGPRRGREAHLDRIVALDAEGRRLLREARARALTGDADVLEALATTELLYRFERVLLACRGAGRALRLVVVKHG